MMPSCLITSAEVAVHTPPSVQVKSLGRWHCVAFKSLNSSRQTALQFSHVGAGVGTHAHWMCSAPSQVRGWGCASTYGGWACRHTNCSSGLQADALVGREASHLQPAASGSSLLFKLK